MSEYGQPPHRNDPGYGRYARSVRFWIKLVVGVFVGVFLLILLILLWVF